MDINNNKLYFGNHYAGDLVKEFGSPLFVYEEKVLRERCRELRSLLPWDNFRVNYSCKANSNLAILKIIREEGLSVDAMSAGEIFITMAAGYRPENILYIPNNVSKDEMRYAIDCGVLISLDSLTQLEYYGQINPGGEAIVRINPGIGDGHHKTVVTAGKAKFGTPVADLDRIKEIAARYDIKIIGLNMHIGSLFLNPQNYTTAIETLLGIAEQFEHLRYIDFGGGLGVPYKKASESRFPMAQFAEDFKSILEKWEQKSGKHNITYIIEPGRYPVAECGTILTTVHSIKDSFDTKYVGTDLGFNLLIRPMLYGAYHEVLVCDNVESSETEPVTVCGNICESGDLVCEERFLPKIELDNTLAVLDSGAYGFVMSSNYNSRLRPAEVLITEDGNAKVIREKENFDYLLLNQKY